MTKETRIEARIEGYELKFTIFDGLDNPIDEGVDLYINDTFYSKVYTGKYNVYQLGEGHQELYLECNDPHYFRSNATLSVDIINTIITEDSLYNTTKVTIKLIDYEGNPIKFGGASLYVDEELYYAKSDEEGYVRFDLNLLPSKYDLRIVNSASTQSKHISLEVIEIYDAKKVSLNIYQDNYKFIITATDFYGNKIDRGEVQIFYGESSTIPIENGTAIFIYSSPENIYDEEKTLTITLKNHQYYEIQTSYLFNATDTIISNDVRPGNRFNATMLDMDKNPIAGTEVVFKLYDRGYFIPMGNITAITDENGFASVEITDKNFDYLVSITNDVTYQSKSLVWINKLNINITPIADYYDENTGIYYIDGHILRFKLDDDAMGKIGIYDGNEYWNEDIIDDTVQHTYLNWRDMMQPYIIMGIQNTWKQCATIQ